MKKLISTKNTEFEQNGAEFAIIDTAQRGGKPIMISSETLSQALINADDNVIEGIEDIQIIRPLKPQGFIVPFLSYGFFLKEFQFEEGEINDNYNDLLEQCFKTVLGQDLDNPIGLTITDLYRNRVMSSVPTKSSMYDYQYEFVYETDDIYTLIYLSVEQGNSNELLAYNENNFYLRMSPYIMYKTENPHLTVTAVIPDNVPLTFEDGTKSAVLETSFEQAFDREDMFEVMFTIPQVIGANEDYEHYLDYKMIDMLWVLSNSPKYKDILSLEDIERLDYEDEEYLTKFLESPVLATSSADFFQGQDGMFLEDGDVLTLSINIHEAPAT